MSDKTLFTLTTLAAAALAGSVQAQSASGFYMTGFAEGSYLDTSQTTYEGDITLGYDGIADMPIGVEVNVLGYGMGGSFLSSVTGAIYYDTDYGRFSIGKPRAAVDDYISETLMGHFALFNFTYLQYTGSTTQYVMLINSNAFSYGLRFDGSINGIDYGISYHALTGGDSVVTAGASYDFADYYTIGLGVEKLPGAGAYNVLASIEAAYDNFGGSLVVKRTGGMSALTYTANAYYDWNDLEVYANYFGASSGVGIYNVGAQYTFLENGYAGVETFGSAGGPSGGYNAFIGWNFAIGG